MKAGECFEAVFALSRGGQIESLHMGAIAIADIEGRLLGGLGDPEHKIFPRSSIKPFQAMPLIEAGGAEEFGLTQAEIALICSSHSGTESHAKLALDILGKIGAEQEDLLCGTHAPYHSESAEDLIRGRRKPSLLQHNCSGKHAGMLALCKLKGWTVDNYVALEHPVQQGAKDCLAAWADFPAEEMIVGVDGCSAANFALPLRNTAQALARLINPGMMEEPANKAAEKIRDAMLKHPDMVGGPGRFDTRLMEVTKGRILSKAGAEGFQALAIREGSLEISSSALGIALKIADGDARSMARSAVSLEVLKQLGALSEAELKQLKGFGPGKTLRNQAGLEVGDSKPVFQLKFN